MEARIHLDGNGVGAHTAYKGGGGVSHVLMVVWRVGGEGGGVSTAGELVLHLLREALQTSEKKAL